MAESGPRRIASVVTPNVTATSAASPEGWQQSCQRGRKKREVRRVDGQGDGAAAPSVWRSSALYDLPDPRQVLVVHDVHVHVLDHAPAVE